MSRERLDIDPTVIDNLPREGHSKHWRELLLANGMLINLGPVGADESPPTQTLRAIQELFGRLPPMESLRTQLAHRIAWNTGTVPKGIWAALGVFFFAVMAGSNLLVAMCGTPIFLVPFALTGLAVAGVLELNRQTELSDTERLLLSDREELAHLTREFLTRDYVCRMAGRTVIVAPTRRWLGQRLAEVRMKRLAADADQALDELQQDLTDALEAYDAALADRVNEDPEFTQDGLEIDLIPLAERLDELQVARRTQPRFAAALIESRRPSGDSPTSA
ncbi:MAG: hypothetical protein GY913_15560 [Proteobacteria bacterium]|nr:hypothetical protein [Pseudomonadota bacterium]MCP4918326.1 hypothetical protein [Pseudomonadota bacterium]